MIDHQARRKCAELVRRLASGRITEEDFDTALASLPWSGNDPVFSAVFEESFSIETTPRRDVARWILFLQADLEYTWPGMGELPDPFHILASVALCVTLGNLLHNAIAGFWLTIAGAVLLTTVKNCLTPDRRTPGDFKVWPFRKQDEFDEARRHPRLLNGNRS